jgi:hypothetical protein
MVRAPDMADNRTPDGGAHLQRFSIIFVDMPRMARDLIRAAVAAEPDIDVAAEFATPGEALAADAPWRGDIVVIGAESLGADTVRVVLGRAPGTRMLTVDASGGHLFLHELHPRRVSLGEVSPGGLLASIRGGGAEAERER